jgi:RNA polymerase sigma-70 factor (ECF subfamily)
LKGCRQWRHTVPLAQVACQPVKISIWNFWQTRRRIWNVAFGARLPAASPSKHGSSFTGSAPPFFTVMHLVFHAPEADLTDFLQEVWTELIKTLRSFRYDRERGRFSSWLYRVVRSKAIDLLRRRTRRPPLNLSSVSQEAIESREDDPATACERNNQQEQVRQVLTQLRQEVSPNNYRLFYLRWIEGRSMEEIGAALGLAPKQVRFRHHRLKRKFQLMYKGVSLQQAPSRIPRSPEPFRVPRGNGAAGLSTPFS